MTSTNDLEPTSDRVASRQRLIPIASVAVMLVVSAVVSAVTLHVLYQAAFEQQRARLTEVVQCRARSIETIVQHEVTLLREAAVGGDASLNPDNVLASAAAITLKQIADIHEKFEGFGVTGEYTLAQREGDQIGFLLSLRHGGASAVRSVPFDAEVAEPMRRALRGESGAFAGLDYRGMTVLAAYEPVAELGWGVVAKIDLAEIRAPFVQAGLLAAGIALLISGIGAGLVAHLITLLLRSIERAEIGREHVRSALRESEEQYRAIFEQATDSIVIIDAGTCEIVDFNDRAHENLGYTRAEFEKLKLSDLDLTRPSEDALRHLAKVRRDGHDTFDTQYMTKNGDVRDVFVRTQFLSTAARNLLASIWSDVTERKALEEQLRDVQKMEAIGELASGIAHDFSNLIAVISASSEALEKTLLDDDGARTEVDRIRKASEQAGDIASSLLVFSRSVPLKKSSLRLKSVLEDTAALLRHSLPAAIELIMEIPDESVGWVYADETQLQRVVLNLGLNARDAMPTGGTIRMSLSLAPKISTADSAAPSESAPRYARITMTDTGMGIPAEIRSRIFEPFFTTKPRGQGTGLGLSSSHGIIEEHGGIIELEPQADRGTSFSIYLPWEDSPRDPERVCLPEARIRGEGQLVLVAEDHEQVRAALAATLELAGYEVVQASDGNTLLERVEEYRGEIQLLIVDVNLPHRDGLTCLSDLRANGCETSAVVITGADPVDFPDLAADDYLLLRKPFHMSELTKIVAALLAPLASERASS